MLLVNMNIHTTLRMQHTNESWRPAEYLVPWKTKTNNWQCVFIFLTNRRVHLFYCEEPFNEAPGWRGEDEFFFLAYPSLPLPTAWLTDWPAVKGAFVSALWRKANQILRLVCLREENGAPGMPSVAEMCRLSDCWGRLGSLRSIQNYAGGITCLAHGQRDSFYKGQWLFIYLFT